jgi:hypothetical protein
MWASSSAPAWVLLPLWWLAMVGFIAAGAGLVGVLRIERFWWPVASVAAIASLGSFALLWDSVLIVGAAIDAAVLAASVSLGRSDFHRWLRAPVHPTRRRIVRAGAVLAVLLALYATGLIYLRPWYMQWGPSAGSRRRAMAPCLTRSIVWTTA